LAASCCKREKQTWQSHLPQSLENAENVQVTSVDGKTYTAKVIGTDSLADLALIKIDGKDFPYVKLTDITPRIGDWVLAVGNPFGLGETVTAGIVSALGRDFGAGPYDDFIQIDAPVNKSNSGGPSFDMDGNVIGVTLALPSALAIAPLRQPRYPRAHQQQYPC
jgi:serine protease Do